MSGPMGEDLGEFTIHLFGDHNVMNATAVIAIAFTEGIDLDVVRKGSGQVHRGQAPLQRKGLW
jgi:UDP-N-acetylmuramate-alanine ligase